MPKTKISEFSSTPANNTDIDSINIAENCPPSGINDAIRELMAQLKDFQTGAVGDSFNGPVGTTTAAAGAFTTLSASSTLGVTGAGSIQGLTVGRGAGAVSTNTAVGASALAANTSGNQNAALGSFALQVNTTGGTNTAVGHVALANNTTASYNTAVGWYSLAFNTTGASNTALGNSALYSNTTASNNTAVGYQALYSNTTGSNSVALGYQALYSNTTGSNSVALGYQAGYSMATVAFGGYATFIGYQAGYSHNDSPVGYSENTFIGGRAGYSVTTGYKNTFIGTTINGANGSGSAVTTGANNVIIGNYTGNGGGLDIRTSNNNIVLSDGDGNPRYYYSGGHYYTGINSGAGTYAMKWSSASGQITYDTSSARYKNNIRDSVYGLSHVMQIRSAQFEYKDDDRSDVGLIAEEVYEVIPELVALDSDGNPNAVSYDRFISVCIKAIQEQQAIIESLKARLDAANL